MGVPTNFPFGITALGVPIVGSGFQLPVANNYWFVSSVVGIAGNPGTSYNLPFATIGAATSVAVAGDCIVLLEGHAETIAAAGGVTVSTAGITIVGLGYGATRPTFTFSTSTAATFLISGASCTISNIVGVCAIDQIVSPFSITGASCTLGLPGAPVEWQDPSSSFQAIRQVLTTTAANNLTINLKVIGVTSGGTAPVNAIRLVGCDTGLINLDFYGRASTAVVEFLTTACLNIEIYGYVYNASNSASSFAKDIVDTQASGVWFASLSDGWVGYDISGGSGSALGPAQAATVIADLAVATVDGTANTYERDVIGNKTDATIQAVTTTVSLMAYTKGLTNALVGGPGIASWAAAAAPANAVSMSEVLRAIFNLSPGGISKSVASITTANLFTVAGGAVKIVNIVGYITTAIQNSANNTKLVYTPTGGTATDVCAVLDVANAGQYGLLTITGTFANALALTATAGIKAGVQAAPFIATPGTLSLNCAGTTTGAIDWYIEYQVMDIDATVVAA